MQGPKLYLVCRSSSPSPCRTSVHLAAASLSPLRRYSLHCRDHKGDGKGNGSREGAKFRSRDSNRDAVLPTGRKSLVQAQGDPQAWLAWWGAPYAWNSIDAARIGIDRSPGAPERNVPAFRSHLFHLVSLRLY